MHVSISHLCVVAVVLVACFLATTDGIQHSFPTAPIGGPSFWSPLPLHSDLKIPLKMEKKETLMIAAAELTNSSNMSTYHTVKVHDNNLKENIMQNLDIFKRGFSELIPSLKNGLKLREKKRKEGLLSLTYEETKQIETAQSDVMTLVSKAFYFSMAKQWFLFSNVVSPLISSNNPWIWVQNFPSCFDSPKMKSLRETVKQQRRYQTILEGFESLHKETIEDAPSKLREERKEQLEVIAKALENKSVSLADAYSILEPWLVVPANSRHLKSIRMQKIPSKVVKSFVRSTGTDGYPNIPLINQLNYGPFRKYFETLLQGDNFLAKKGIENLTPGDISFACKERGIAVENKSPLTLKKELSDWMTLVNRNFVSENNQAMAVNPLEKRLALFALNVAREFPQLSVSYALRGLAQ